MRIASFDIGLKTCSMCVEDYKVDNSISTPPEKDRYIKKLGQATETMVNFVNEIAQCGSLVWLEKRDLGDKAAYHAGYAFLNLYNWLHELDTHLKTCDLILIEQQMLTNNMALSLMNHLHAYLLIKYTKEASADNKVPVKLYQSKNKTRVLGAPLNVEEDDISGKKLKTTSKYDRKKWSTQRANEILLLRDDKVWHKYIFVDNKKKKDDLSDVIMQNLSYVVKSILKEDDEK